jgi:hypothetical protein
MLYDNALLARAYTDAFLLTGNEKYRTTVRETLDYVLRDMTDPAGGFYSAEDADSEGEEGLFYTWTADEIDAVLGEDRGTTFGRVYDVTDAGNFEGRNILNLPKKIEQCAKILKRPPDDLAAELAESRAELFAVREKRVHPGKDDKVIAAWNGLMIDAMARAGAALGESKYIFAADAAGQFILDNMRRDDGRLLHTWRGGIAKLDAYLDDYTAVANSFVTLYESTGNERWIAEAVRLMDVVLEKFADPIGGFFYTADDHEVLLTRTKELTDSSLPSGNALAATALLRLGKLLGNTEYLRTAEAVLAAAAPLMQRVPMAAGQMLLALDRFLGPAQELLLVGDNQPMDEAVRAVQRRYLPRIVFAFPRGDGTPGSLFEPHFGAKKAAGVATLYVCENFACQEPVVGLAAIEAKLDELTAGT